MADRTHGGCRVSPGDLLERARAVGRQARQSGALVTMNTDLRVVPDDGVPFVVRVSPNLERKRAAEAALVDAPEDPLSPPYEQDLYVGDVSPTHVALLNKFNVLDDHLLLVTRERCEQTEMLDVSDYEALLIGLAAFDGLAFYNGGSEGGASQPHKHLQVVPLPLGPGGSALPFGPLLERAGIDGVGRIPDLPFRHAVTPFVSAWLTDPPRHARAAADTAAALWRALGHDGNGTYQPMPYNFLATRRFMWLVPRTRAGLPGLPVNALGFAGALLAIDEEAFGRLCRMGPMELLTAVGAPESP